MAIKKNSYAFILGTVSVLAFSLTLPLTKYLVAYQSIFEVGLLRGLIAAIFAAFILLFFAKKTPNKTQIKKLIVVSMTIVLGFPLLIALSMSHLSPGYGAVILACLPIMTAIFGSILGHEKPKLAFWFLSCLGISLVMGYSFFNTLPQKFGIGDVILFCSAICAGLGYAQGGLLAKEIQGWEVICWALLIALPALLFFSILNFNFENFFTLGYPQWLAIFYLGIVNSLFGFFIWYEALALGGVEKVGQTQLLQPLFTYFFSILFFQDSVTTEAIFLFLLLIMLVIKIKNI